MENIETISIAELVKTEEFLTNMREVMKQVGKSRLKLANEARQRDRQLKRHPYDRLIEVLDNTEDDAKALSEMFLEVMEKKSKQPAAIRNIIESIGMQAFNRTMDAEVKKNPELKKKFRKFV